jgi:Cu(I)/Ag(I) efflux system membrane fusion protein
MRMMRSVALLCLGLIIGLLAAHWLYVSQPSALNWARDLLLIGKNADIQAGPDEAAKEDGKKLLYYRHPMGLPETSQEPKQDSMGMDYIPVYEGEAADESGTVTISTERIQRSGVRTEPAAMRPIVRPVIVPGAVTVDEGRVKVVSLRAEGFIEELFIDRTGQPVEKGEKLFRVYMPLLQQAQVDLLLTSGERGATGLSRQRLIDGASQKLRNLGVDEDFIARVVEKGENIRTIDWTAPLSGVVLEKKVVEGQRVMPGDELYRIADLSSVWVIANVPEHDLSHVRIGDDAEITFRAFPDAPRLGKIAFIYPDLKPETRTARVRIELDNSDGALRADMYADVAIRSARDTAPVLAVPESALIDSGKRQVVLVAKGEGKFEPRAVTIGRRGEGHVEITDGVSEGEDVVTAANFLIDAESNLKAALSQFTAPEQKP